MIGDIDGGIASADRKRFSHVKVLKYFTIQSPFCVHTTCAYDLEETWICENSYTKVTERPLPIFAQGNN